MHMYLGRLWPLQYLATRVMGYPIATLGIRFFGVTFGRWGVGVYRMSDLPK